MAGDWIKMRPSLLTDPKVNGIARALESCADVSRALSTGFKGGMSEIVTRNVMRYVTVASLLLVWGAANEHTKAGVFVNADLSDLDDIAGVPGFGRAMQSVGWAVVDDEAMTVTLPNFNEYNTSGKQRSSNGAERQRRYRERKAGLCDAPSDVTRDASPVTKSYEREEKRREDLKEETTSLEQPSAARSRFAEFWAAYPNRVGRKPCEAKWKAKRLDERADTLVADVKNRIANDGRWLDGYVPNPATYLAQERWNDDLQPRRDAPQPTPPSGPMGPKKPSETPLERQLAWLRSQLHYEQITQDDHDRLCVEATAKYRQESATCS